MENCAFFGSFLYFLPFFWFLSQYIYNFQDFFSRYTIFFYSIWIHHFFYQITKPFFCELSSMKFSYLNTFTIFHIIEATNIFIVNIMYLQKFRIRQQQTIFQIDNVYMENTMCTPELTVRFVSLFVIFTQRSPKNFGGERM